MTRTRAAVSATRQSWKAGVLLTGRRAAMSLSVPASAPLTGAGSST